MGDRGFGIFRRGNRLFRHESLGNVATLRNSLCRLDDPQRLARVAAHLRNFGVTESVVFCTWLNGHKSIPVRPALSVHRALYQLGQGTVENPFAHVLPAHVALNRRSLPSYCETSRAVKGVQRILGMGVMAPQDWKKGAFPYGPRQHNTVDWLVERHNSEDGSVAALARTLQVAVDFGTWDGSGVHPHGVSRLKQIAVEIVGGIWMPLATEFYSKTLLRLEAQRALEQTPERRVILEQRIQILQMQKDEHQKASVNQIVEEATRNIVAVTVDEKWRPRSNTII